MKKWIYFCPDCDNQVYSVGWGMRANCPHCEKIVTVKKVLVTALKPK